MDSEDLGDGHHSIFPYTEDAISPLKSATYTLNPHSQHILERHKMRTKILQKHAELIKAIKNQKEQERQRQAEEKSQLNILGAIQSKVIDEAREKVGSVMISRNRTQRCQTLFSGNQTQRANYSRE